MTKKRYRGIVVAAIVAVSMLAGAGVAVAAHTFSDVPDSNIFHDDIDFLAERGITLGCGGGNFCPSQIVTREQMAAFLKRTAQALSPTVLSQARFTEDAIAGFDVFCETRSVSAPFEQIATADAGLYVFDAETDGLVRAKTVVRVNGGAWQEMQNALNLTQSVDAGDHAATHTQGVFRLEAGNSYEFAVGAMTAPAAAQTGCQLVVTVSHRMPAEG